MRLTSAPAQGPVASGWGLVSLLITGASPRGGLIDRSGGQIHLIPTYICPHYGMWGHTVIGALGTHTIEQ